jgi:hypothetical protein
MKVLGMLEQSRTFWVLFITSFFFFLFRFPSLFEPYWYGDEGIYHVLGDGINNGRILYRDIWDNKPPLLYTTYAIFNSDQFLVRLASLVTGLASVVLFFFLAQRLFNSQKAQYVTTGIFALLFGLPIIEGNIANAENFMLAPIIAAAVLILNSKNRNYLFFSGFLLSLAFLFKIVAFFDFLAFLLFLTYVRKANIRSFILGFILPIALTFFYFFLNGAHTDFLKAAFSANVSYVGYGNKLVIPQGLLLLKLAALSLFSIFVLRRNLGEKASFILLWFGFSLFNAFFSQRPYTHYLLVLLPSFALLIGLLFDVKIKKIALPIFIVALSLVLTNFGYYGKTIFYYQNFLSFVNGGKNVWEYNRFFDRRTVTDYELANYININTDSKDSIFIWGNNAQLYTLTNKLPPARYTVAYHVSGAEGIKETRTALEKTKPKLIIVMPYMRSFPFTLHGYFQKIVIDGVIIYERI